MSNYLESTRGGIEIGGSTSGSIAFEVVKNFLFSAGPCTEYWWQVIGECISTTLVTDCPTPGPKSCPKQMIINIMGCSLVDVCNKIAARGYNIVIAEIYQYTLPALASQQNGECGAYVQVYPGTDLPQNCLPYDFVTDPENWGMNFEVENLKFNSGGVSGTSGTSGESGSGISGISGISGHSGYSGISGFDTEFPGGLTESQDVIANSCCDVIPVTVTLTHNLNDSDKLNKFLARNGLVLPSNFDLIYSVVSYSWQANYHFQGIGDDGTSTEVWNLVFEWSCTDEVGSMVVDQIWTFGFYVNIQNLNTRRRYNTRILAAFSPVDVCSSNGLYYGFALNTVTKTINSVSTGASLNVNVDLNTCYDNAGLFAAIDWLSNPILNINIWQNGTPTQQQYLDISSLANLEDLWKFY